MASTSQGLSESNGPLSKLDEVFQILNLAKDKCGISPARVAFASANDLLTTIKVRSLLFYNDEVLIRVYSGLCGQ